jgi:organic radical activating enzyme
MNGKIAALYGAGRNSLAAERILRYRLPDLQIPYLIEGKDMSKLGQEIPREGGNGTLKVISVEGLKKRYKEKQCTAVIVPAIYHIFDLREIRDTLDRAGIVAEDIYAVPHNRIIAGEQGEGPGLENMVLFDKLIQLWGVDVHVTDHCNLKCKSCNHFCTLVNNPVFYEEPLVRKSLQRLAGLVPGISHIALLGGEPLLHREIKKIMFSTRECFPYAKVFLTTNALLLENMTPDFFQAVRDANIIINVSLYSPMRNKVDVLVDIFRKNAVRFLIKSYDHFERRLVSQSVFEKEKQFKKCGHNMALRGSRLGYCVMALFTDYYNTYFGKDLLPEDQGVDIFAHQDGKSLLAALNQPLDLCAQCVSREAGQMFFEPWEPGTNPSPEDWFIRLPLVN